MLFKNQITVIIPTSQLKSDLGQSKPDKIGANKFHLLDNSRTGQASMDIPGNSHLKREGRTEGRMLFLGSLNVGL